MTNFHSSAMPRRIVALSLLPPPGRLSPPAPFGFGAFVIDVQGRGEATFDLHAHGYGARYDPRRIRCDIARLFTPDTRGLFYAPVPAHERTSDMSGKPFPCSLLDHLPRIGHATSYAVLIPHDILADAAGIGHLDIPPSKASPLQRIARIGAEAQAAWIYWLFKAVQPRLRRDLLASYHAWSLIEGVRRRR
jgi:hypothetical protein